MATIWRGGDKRRVWGVERRRGVKFFCKCNEDNVDHDDDGHDGADCGDDNSRDYYDDRDEH
jgi:hypothetical protein